MSYHEVVFDRQLIEQCQANVPRYTSYPTADRFIAEFGEQDQLLQIKQIFTADFDEAISLYIHIPFCNTLCLFCACNKIITNDRSKITHYLKFLEKEMSLYAAIIGRKLKVIQLHYGGGSPSWLSIDELNQLSTIITKYFDLEATAEVAMELDPRHVTDEFMLALKENGFNRVSLGVQDYAPIVQKAVNRIQPLARTKQVLTIARHLGFKSTNIDLIYGLPFQTLASFKETISITLQELVPARIALFNYAHLPSVFYAQTRINEQALPSASEKLDILQMCVERLTKEGYVFIGMDHFALPDDELAIALKNGTLQRNFQGYTTYANSQLLSFGVSAIRAIGFSYSQNVKDIERYYGLLNNNKLPVMRGIRLTYDDIIRREVIHTIMCQFKLDFFTIKQKFQIDFLNYFAQEMNALNVLQQKEMLALTNDGLKVTAKGRFLIRNIALVFDKRLQLTRNSQIKHYSKAI